MLTLPFQGRGPPSGGGVWMWMGGGGEVECDPLHPRRLAIAWGGVGGGGGGVLPSWSGNLQAAIWPPPSIVWNYQLLAGGGRWSLSPAISGFFLFAG